MRTQTLQYLYLQKPVTMIVILCMISVLPWIASNEFATKGEPREASVAISMLETGNWILPYVYADEIAYKPPMAHWLMAAFSYPQGYVSEFTSRLPSAIAYIVLMGFVLFFFGERIKFQEAFIATLLLMTCLEIHRAGLTTRLDMLLTAFMVIGLFQMYRWENKLELKGLPISIPILLGCAILTKGPVGLILPLFIFFVYLLVLNKYKFLIVFKALLYIGISSVFLPLIWYVAAWRQGGDYFLDLVIAENFGRFLHIDNPDMHYRLGQENGVWHNFYSVIAGFIPWSFFFIFSLFGIKWRKPNRSFKQILKDSWTSIRSMEKIKLFSLVTIVCIFFFFSIPSSKRSVYLMQAYPFIAIFLAQYAIYLTEYRTKVTRVFAGFLAGVLSVLLILIGLTHVGLMDPVDIVSKFTQRPNTLAEIAALRDSLASNSLLIFVVLVVNLMALSTVFYQMSKKINIKILYSTIFLVFTLNLLIDGVIMHSIKNSVSARPFAEYIMDKYPLDRNNVYVMNYLREYDNLYGLNFYMGNMYHNFEKEKPAEGYFMGRQSDWDKVYERYKDTYSFILLEVSDKVLGDIRDRAVLYSFTRTP
ncbi:MAG: glycosyltransferase family 39 protein [Tannerellaceae bacterium]|nr:glycosyltransferase family 39 protein [Tannerellaceae bacterium]